MRKDEEKSTTLILFGLEKLFDSILASSHKFYRESVWDLKNLLLEIFGGP